VRSVNVTFVNYAGERTRLPGRVGDSLLEVAARYKYSFVDGACQGGGSPVDVLHAKGNWLEPKYGEGAFCHFCHVIIPKSHYSMLPAKRPDETEQLGAYPFKEDLAETCVRSRRARSGGAAAAAARSTPRARHNSPSLASPPLARVRPFAPLQLEARLPGQAHEGARGNDRLRARRAVVGHSLDAARCGVSI